MLNYKKILLEQWWMDTADIKHEGIDPNEQKII